ncbi:MAG: hypothetical protein IIW72_09135, partial [Clostridia bacterium]|nr:hypothetical protein [Clostridia bacterium]
IITVIDARIALLASVNIVTLTSEQKSACDVVTTGVDNGVITTADARKALRVASGLEASISDEAVFDYFLNEINTVKTTTPGFKRTATGTCKSAKITVSGAPSLMGLDCRDKEYVDFIRDSESLLKDDSNPEEYDKMLKDAENLYTPQTESKVVPAENRVQHINKFPVSGLAVSCRLTIDDIESVSFKTEDKYYIITITLGDYKYDSKNPYPAAPSQQSERKDIPYGKVFNLLELSEADAKKLKQVDLKDGKVTLKIDSTTGEIINSDFFFKITTVLEDVSTAEGVGGKVYNIVMQTKMAYEFDEFFDMTIKA